jgi:primosomal protein N' (replication factor Y) (superfamily II helicase)
MRSFARVAVNVPSLTGVFVDARDEGPHAVRGAFDYEVPDRLAGNLAPGHLIIVPFGNQTVQAVVLRLMDEPGVASTRSILELVDPLPILTSQQVALAEWMAEDTLASVNAVIGLFLPPGLGKVADVEFSINASAAAGWNRDAAGSKSGLEQRLMRLLQDRGPLRGRQIDRSLPRIEWRRTARSLVRRGVWNSRSVLPSASVRPKFIRTAQLTVEPESAQGVLTDLGHNAATRLRREKALSYLISRPQAVNVSWVYAESGCNLADLQELAERDLIALREQEVWRDPLGKPASAPAGAAGPAARPQLTADQQQAWDAIAAGFVALSDGKPINPFLLQGVTGSGKTEIYLRATEEALKRGRQALVLVPEIALTPQTIDRFVSRFPGQVGLIHSRLSEGERYDTWRRARAGSLRIIIGPRSALFMPLPNLGLLVADECHDSSYHQAEPPFYDALLAAQMYARICGAVCIQGSATPTVVQRYRAETARESLLELPRRIASGSATQPAPALDLPPVQVVDLREELKAGNRGVFSRTLKAGLDVILSNHEQAILFLNRRGTATYVFCRNCGYVVRCARCDTPLTYHVTGASALLCHRCGYERQMPKTCPECRSTDIRAYGLGTERVEAEVQKAFPGARTLRWDWETTRQKDAHEIILHHFAAGHADILIGTQMLAKGLDLPRVTLVGIVLADAGLFLPDPFAAERVFQVLTQVAGRAGRSTLGGRVILQSYVPDHPAILAAADHDVLGFYRGELAQRQRLGYPPFARLLRLEYRHHDPSKAEEATRAVAGRLQRLLAAAPGTKSAMIGPAPCFLSRLDGQYRWQIVLRGADFGPLLAGQRFDDWRIEPDPVSLL